MQSLLERFLYISLALAFIGVGVEGVYVISSTQKLDQELKNQAIELQDIQQLDRNLQRGITGLKASNDQQTTEIQCLLSALNVGSFPGNCQSPATSAPTGGSISNNGNASPSPASSPAPARSSSPSGGGNNPSPSPNPVAGFVTATVHVITDLVKSL